MLALCPLRLAHVMGLGESGGPRLVFDAIFEVTVEEAIATYEDTIPELMAG